MTGRASTHNEHIKKNLKICARTDSDSDGAWETGTHNDERILQSKCSLRLIFLIATLFYHDLDIIGVH